MSDVFYGRLEVNRGYCVFSNTPLYFFTVYVILYAPDSVDKIGTLFQTAGNHHHRNGLLYITGGTNAVISVKVNKTVDLGTHLMFIGEVTEEKVLSDVPSATYH